VIDAAARTEPLDSAAPRNCVVDVTVVKL